ncbi:MAG: glycosyltransferase [bacterium]|nr:glycosyltransferase [bacterium]
MKIALIHDWLNGMRGGEKVLEIFCELYPTATIYTLLYEPEKVSETIRNMRVISSGVLPRLPFGRAKYRQYLPLFPTLIEQFDLREYDLIISTSHCVAKGIIPGPQSTHICYCFTPMRYIWDLYHDYFSGEQHSWLWNLFIPPVIHYLRLWDRLSSDRVDYFIADSQHVANKIKKYYRREATVIYPPVDTSFYQPTQSNPEEDYYLVVSAFVPYKRIELAIQAFNRNGKRLKLAGNGPELKRLHRIATSAQIEFLGWVDDQTLRTLYSGCRALIFPGVEDFGITPLEAMSCGRPVIAYRKGGVVESVIDTVTGIFFDEPTPEAINHAITRFEQTTFSSEQIRQHALKFDKQRFIDQIERYIETIMSKMNN